MKTFDRYLLGILLWPILLLQVARQMRPIPTFFIALPLYMAITVMYDTYLAIIGRGPYALIIDVVLYALFALVARKSVFRRTGQLLF